MAVAFMSLLRDAWTATAVTAAIFATAAVIIVMVSARCAQRFKIPSDASAGFTSDFASPCLSPEKGDKDNKWRRGRCGHTSHDIFIHGV